MISIHFHYTVVAALMVSVAGWGGLAQTAIASPASFFPSNLLKQGEQGCPASVLERITLYTIQTGDTLARIAEQYDLSPATVRAFNPEILAHVQDSETLKEGDRLQIPPYDGSVQAVPPDITWPMLAEALRMRADVLFELNGCGMTPPERIFVPGAAAHISQPSNPMLRQPISPSLEAPDPLTFDQLPLTALAPIMTTYGWQSTITQEQSTFHPGVDFAVESGAAVQVFADGTLAFVGDRGPYGLLIVVNHDRGVQTRYAQLSQTQVSQGDRVVAGEVIGQSGQSGDAPTPHLHFEVRLNSTSGWLAQDPLIYLNALQE